MPLIIVLRNPNVNLIVQGDIKDKDEKYWDGIFNNFQLMVKDERGDNIVIPLMGDCNVAFIKHISEEDLKKQREEMKEQAERKGGSNISVPNLVFPRSNPRRGGGGGHRL